MPAVVAASSLMPLRGIVMPIPRTFELLGLAGNILGGTDDVKFRKDDVGWYSLNIGSMSVDHTGIVVGAKIMTPDGICIVPLAPDLSTDLAAYLSHVSRLIFVER